MRYETAVFDLDGILLKDGMMTRDGKAAVELLLENDVQVVYSSGKNYWYTAGGLSFSNLIRDDTIIMAENGGIVFYPISREKITLSEDNGDIEAVSKAFVRHHCTEDDGGLVLNDPRTPLWREPKETIFTLFPTDVSTIPAIRSYMEAVVAKNGLGLYVISHSDAVDAVPIGQDKGKALEYLSKHKALDLGRTMAFGDGSNDLEMLSAVGLPVTVGNADQAVRDLVERRGGIVTKASYGKGALEAVESIIRRP